MDSSYLMELSNIYIIRRYKKIMELELTKVELKKEITTIEGLKLILIGC